MSVHHAVRRAVLGAVVALLLAGCAGGEVDGDGVSTGSPAKMPSVVSFKVKAVDGRTIPCIWAKSGYGGGLSCDWGAR